MTLWTDPVTFASTWERAVVRAPADTFLESPPDIAALHAWCAERLTKSKRPRDRTLVERLPRTSVGKIRKFLLRDPKGIPA